jgi:site-specific recombinase XerD
VRYEQSRFARDLEDFGVWLQSAGYSRDCMRGHLFRLRLSTARLTDVPVGAAFTPAQLDAVFLSKRMRRRRMILFRSTRGAYQRFLSSQERLSIPPVDAPFAEICRRYVQELREVRGFAVDTLKQHDWTARDFLAHTVSAGQTLRDLRPADVDRYVVHRSQTVRRQRLQHVVAQLRAFLGFCRAQALIDRPLEAIDSVRAHADELPPRALPWPLVQALVRSIDRSSRSGRRDYAILHLAAYYGLRPGEVASLRIDRIDFKSRVMEVEQHKTRWIIQLPLGDRTVAILQDYLENGRPHSSLPHLFLRAYRPPAALTRYGIGDIFSTRAAQSGLPMEGYSVYSLRHAFAMRLLDRGVGLKAIGDVLGHRRLSSTCQYLRLQIDALREVALAVPTPEGGA